MEEVFDNLLQENLAKISLEAEICHLKHNDIVEYKAVNYLCQMLGGNDVVQDLLRIPICEECEAALLGDEWILFYCISCNSSQWVLREKAKKDYSKDQNVYFFINCPTCYED
jgi:hypothetical protein